MISSKRLLAAVLAAALTGISFTGVVNADTDEENLNAGENLLAFAPSDELDEYPTINTEFIENSLNDWKETYENSDVSEEDEQIIADETPENIYYGDLNNDGTADLTDLTLLSLFLMGSADLTNSEIEAADIDGNGEADIADLAYFKQFVCKDSNINRNLLINFKKHTLKAEIKEVDEKEILVDAYEFSDNSKVTSLIRINYDSEKETLNVGDTVEIIYDGSIMESLPPQIHSHITRKI